MGTIIYEEHPVRRGGFVNYHNINANAGFLTHTYNLLTLQWIRDHTTDWREKRQCDTEIGIASRKIEYHRKHPNFRLADVEKELAKLKRSFKPDDRFKDCEEERSQNPGDRDR